MSVLETLELPARDVALQESEELAPLPHLCPWTPELIANWYAARHLRSANEILGAAGLSASAALRFIEEILAGEPSTSFCRRACEFIKSLLHARPALGEPALALASALAHEVRDRYIFSDGSIIEYDRASWLEEHEIWRSVPWGTAFRGRELLDCFRWLAPHMNAAERLDWELWLGRVARWIKGNPVAGSVVYNCAIDLQGLLYELGQEFNNSGWCASALRVGIERTRRDLSPEGWIMGEGVSCSGFYQMVGLEFLGLFAWRSGDETLREFFLRGYRAAASWCAPDMQYAGNFGTRSTWFGPLKPVPVLLAAALGDQQAAGWVARFGKPEWCDRVDLWNAAMRCPTRAVAHPPAYEAASISGARVSAGGWTGWWTSNPHSLWARGWIGLHHKAAGPVFSTLHSLNSTIEKSKLQIGDTSEWSGFPAVRVFASDAQYCSHRDVGCRWELRELGEVPVVSWQETLLDDCGNAGGELRGKVTFWDNVLGIALEVRKVPPGSKIVLDFHILKEARQHFGLWTGEHAQDILAGKLPHTSGHFDPVTLDPTQPGICGVQVGRSIFSLTWDKLSARGEAVAELARTNGLHTGNKGGGRVRFRLPYPPEKELATWCFRLSALPIE